MNPIRIAALTFLAAASVLLLLDVMEMLLSTNWNGTGTAYLWAIIWPSSLMAVERFFELYISAGLWRNVLMPMLRLPIWIMLSIIGIVLFMIGRRLDD